MTELRNKMGLSKKKFAEKVGSSRVSIWKYEVGDLTIPKPIEIICGMLEKKLK